VAREDAVADGVDAAVHDVQAPGLHAAIDRARAEPERAELCPPDDAVLAAGEQPDLSKPNFAFTINVNFGFDSRHAP
jgi:hypothetical protein